MSELSSSGLANLNRSLRLGSAADLAASMNFALEPTMAQPNAMKAMELGRIDSGGGGPSAATLGYDLSRLLASRIIGGDSSLALQGGSSSWGDSSGAYPGIPGHGPLLSELGLTNPFAFGEATIPESSQLGLLLNHQNKLALEEQIRRRLLSDSLLSSHARSIAPTFGMGGVVRRDSNNVLADEGPSGIDRLNELVSSYSQGRFANDLGSALARTPSCPPIKKQRRGDSKLDELLENIAKRNQNTKHRFPSPSAKRSRKVRIRDLAVLHERWRNVRERLAPRGTELRLKEAFEKELFARSLVRGSNSQSLEGRLKEAALPLITHQ